MSDNFYIAEEESLLCEVGKNLPKIQGVEWHVTALRKVPEFGFSKLVVRVTAEIDSGNGFNLEEVLNKVHEITSNGQVKLELEK